MRNPISSWLKASILFLALSASALGAQQQTNGGATKATGATNVTKAKPKRNKPLPISKAARVALKQAATVAAKGKGKSDKP